MYREIKTTVIEDNTIQYRELGLLQVFEFLNILEESLYNKTELTKIETNNLQNRLTKLQDKFKEIGEKESASEIDIKMLLNRESREKLLSILNKFYVDVDIQNLESKLFFKLYNFIAEQLFSADITKLLS